MARFARLSGHSDREIQREFGNNAVTIREQLGHLTFPLDVWNLSDEALPAFRNLSSAILKQFADAIPVWRSHFEKAAADPLREELRQILAEVKFVANHGSQHSLSIGLLHRDQVPMLQCREIAGAGFNFLQNQCFICEFVFGARNLP